MFFPRGSLRLTHQVKLISSFWNALARKTLSRCLWRAGRFVDLPDTPSMHGRIDVTELPFVSGDLAARVHVPFAQEQNHLLLGELGVQLRHRDHVKRQVPSGVPRVFPLVGHRDHVSIE